MRYTITIFLCQCIPLIPIIFIRLKYKEENYEGDDGDMETEEENDENEEEYSDDDDMSWKVILVPFFSFLLLPD